MKLHKTVWETTAAPVGGARMLAVLVLTMIYLFVKVENVNGTFSDFRLTNVYCDIQL